MLKAVASQAQQTQQRAGHPQQQQQQQVATFVPSQTPHLPSTMQLPQRQQQEDRHHHGRSRIAAGEHRREVRVWVQVRALVQVPVASSKQQAQR